MIRELTADELHLVVPLGEAFSKETGFPDVFAFNGDAFKHVWSALINAKVGVVFMDFDDDTPIGMIGAVQSPNDKDGKLVVQECFWFTDPKYRRKGGVRLVEHLETWARGRGAARMTMVHLAHMNVQALSRLYMSMGYAPAEIHYVKLLG